MRVTTTDVRRAVRSLDLAGRPLCVHASLRSFGRVDGGAPAILAGLLAAGSTVLVPTFSGAAFEEWPDPPDPIPRNGLPPMPRRRARPAPVYDPGSNEMDRDMGAASAAVLAHPGRVRGAHPTDSFAAVGPLARTLVAGQGPERVYAPLEALAAAGGTVVLMGVGLERLTLLHLAEQRAGRRLFVRWARGRAGDLIRIRVGGCSEGFGRLAPALAPLTRHVHVGASRWSVLPAAAALDAAAAAIRADPTLTHCGNPACDRCDDAVRGGPPLPA